MTEFVMACVILAAACGFVLAIAAIGALLAWARAAALKE
jgi:hypothetical protein